MPWRPVQCHRPTLPPSRPAPPRRADRADDLDLATDVVVNLVADLGLPGGTADDPVLIEMWLADWDDLHRRPPPPRRPTPPGGRRESRC